MSSSNGPITDKATLTAFERWELPQVRDDRSPVVEEADISPLTAEQIEALQKSAYDEAYAAGLAAGRRKGLEEGMAEARPQVQNIEHLLKTLSAPLAEVEQQTLDELTSLAIAIARQLIRRELESHPDEIVAVVREAVNALPSATLSIKVMLHPDDLVLVRDVFSLENSEGQSWMLAPDPVITRGGCRIEGGASRIDATVEKRLNAVVAELFGGARNSDSEQGDG